MSLRGRAARRLALAREFVAAHDAHRARILPFDAALGLWALAVLPATFAAGGYAAAGVASLVALPLVTTGLPRATSAAAGLTRLWYPFVLVPLLYAALPVLMRGLHGERFFDEVTQRWEVALFGHQPATTLAAHAPWLPFSELLHAAYLSYYLLIWLPPLLIYLSGDMEGFIASATAFVLASLLCFVVFVYFPVQGPRYLYPAPSAGSIDAGPVYQLTHLVLEGGSTRGAAFPSGHVAVATAQAIIAWRYLRTYATWITIVAVLLAVSTVYGGFHYAVDALAGTGVGAGAALAGMRMARSAARNGF